MTTVTVGPTRTGSVPWLASALNVTGHVPAGSRCARTAYVPSASVPETRASETIWPPTSAWTARAVAPAVPLVYRTLNEKKVRSRARPGRDRALRQRVRAARTAGEATDVAIVAADARNAANTTVQRISDSSHDNPRRLSENRGAGSIAGFLLGGQCFWEDRPMSFDVAAVAYDRFMGRYSNRLAHRTADWRACGQANARLTSAAGRARSTTELVRRLGPSASSAVDPSEPFVAAARSRNPGVEVPLASAERVPFTAASFDMILAQLVVHFMPDPVAGIAEMAPGDAAGRRGGRLRLGPYGGTGRSGRCSGGQRTRSEGDIVDESQLPGAREGHLAGLFAAARAARDRRPRALRQPSTRRRGLVDRSTHGVGPAGVFVAGLDPAGQTELRDLCRTMLPPRPLRSHRPRLGRPRDAARNGERFQGRARWIVLVPHTGPNR